MKLVESKNNTETDGLGMNGSNVYSESIKLQPKQIPAMEKLNYSEKKSLFNTIVTLTEKGQNIIDVLDQFICHEFNITKDELTSEDRYMPLPKARGAFTSILRSNFDFPLKIIGIHLGGRDHSAILMAEKRAKEFYKKNASFRSHYDRVEKYFKDLLSGDEFFDGNHNKNVAG